MTLAKSCGHLVVMLILLLLKSVIPSMSTCWWSQASIVVALGLRHITIVSLRPPRSSGQHIPLKPISLIKPYSLSTMFNLPLNTPKDNDSTISLSNPFQCLKSDVHVFYCNWACSHTNHEKLRLFSEQHILCSCACYKQFEHNCSASWQQFSSTYCRLSTCIVLQGIQALLSNSDFAKVIRPKVLVHNMDSSAVWVPFPCHIQLWSHHRSAWCQYHTRINCPLAVFHTPNLFTSCTRILSWFLTRAAEYYCDICKNVLHICPTSTWYSNLVTPQNGMS